ncbi:unnamed protein product [Pleuronectes platessa]|uniref:Uncharacterized protein n=1 Tax=Pleuronectes platessa TaxID=8262 RepID=A0A9N7VG33_PLEPL|nr:unnamed protein product [Pleuronectes platessa]
MITGQLSKPLLSLRSNMSAAELRADDKAATPDSELNDEPLLLPSEATDREGTPNKLYAHSGRFGLGNRCQMTCQKRERQGPVRRHGTVVSSAGRDREDQ